MTAVVRRTIVRCKQNRFDTPLFSYDPQGIYVRCKDCRSVDTRTQEIRRGAFHLITWGQLFRLMVYTAAESVGFSFGIINEGGDHGGSSRSGIGPGESVSHDEGISGDDEFGGDGREREARDQGGRLDESELQVSGVSSPNPNGRV